MSIVIMHHRFTVADYDQICEYGILGENDRVELIRGEIVDKMPIGERHAACVNRLNRLLSRAVGDRAQVSVQNPVHLMDSQPEPDLTLLRPRDDFYDSGKPRPSDVLLVIEVADSTLDFDREVKRPMYAESGIEEFWILNLVADTLEVHRQPRADGTYRESNTFTRDQSVEPATLPGMILAVAEML